MKKTLLRLSMPALVAGVGLLSAMPAYCDLPPVVIPVDHPRDKIPMLQVEPSRIQGGFWSKLFKNLPLSQRVLLGSVKPPAPTDIIKRLEGDSLPSGHHRGGSVWGEGGPGGTVAPTSRTLWRKSSPLPPIEMVGMSLVSAEPATMTVDPLAMPVFTEPAGPLTGMRGYDKKPPETPAAAPDPGDAGMVIEWQQPLTDGNGQKEGSTAPAPDKEGGEEPSPQPGDAQKPQDQGPFGDSPMGRWIREHGAPGGDDKKDDEKEGPADSDLEAQDLEDVLKKK